MFFTGEARERERREAMQAGADAYLIKPNDLKKLAETVKQLLDIHNPATRQDAPQKAYRPVGLHGRCNHVSRRDG
jgi:DNA-binding response OmpR family regulator